MAVLTLQKLARYVLENRMPLMTNTIFIGEKPLPATYQRSSTQWYFESI